MSEAATTNALQVPPARSPGPSQKYCSDSALPPPSLSLRLKPRSGTGRFTAGGEPAKPPKNVCIISKCTECAAYMALQDGKHQKCTAERE